MLVPEYKGKSNYLGFLIYKARSINLLVMNSEPEREENKDEIHSLEDEEEDELEDDDEDLDDEK